MNRLTAVALFFAATLISPLASAAFVPAPPQLDAKSYVLMDFASGDVIASKNPDEKLAPASITKVMTVYIAFDEIKKGQLKLSDKVLVSKKAWSQGLDSSESRMFIEVGTRVSVADLLRGIIVDSGNDAAVALAEHIAGSEDVFAQLMNRYAKKLGMRNSHFVDASGLPSDDHYMTARDIAILARALIQNFPDLYKMFAEKDFTYDKIHQNNRNGLLWKDPSVDGLKTGHTQEAGYCLLASAERDGRRLISIVMGAPTWNDREQYNLDLLNYGFRFYETDQLLGSTSPALNARVYQGDVEQLPVGTDSPVYLALPRGSRDKLTIQPKLRTPLVAPISRGQPVGQATVMLAGKPVKTVQLVALKPVAKGGLWHRVADQIRLWIHH